LYNTRIPSFSSRFPIAATPKPAYTAAPVGSKQPVSSKDVAVGLAALGAAALAAMFGVKKKPITLQETQKAFQELFMNKDITLGETKVMLDKYKEIEQIQDYDKYANALYDYAKENYGLKDVDLPLVLKDSLQDTKIVETMGGAHDNLSSVDISRRNKRTKLLNTVHHELRHIKQTYYALCLDKDKTMRAQWPKGHKYYQDVADDTIEQIEKRFGKLSPDKVSDEYKGFALKCIEGKEKYADAHKDIVGYWTNFLEQDARKAGDLADKYIGGKNVHVEDGSIPNWVITKAAMQKSQQSVISQ